MPLPSEPLHRISTFQTPLLSLLSSLSAGKPGNRLQNSNVQRRTHDALLGGGLDDFLEVVGFTVVGAGVMVSVSVRGL